MRGDHLHYDYRRMIGTLVKCDMDDCLYCENGECMRTEIYLSDDHVCDGGCDEGWLVAKEGDQDDS